MHYISPTQLPELAAAADRAQRYIDATLDDLEALPASSIEFRAGAIKQLVDAIYRLTAIRKTLVALRASIDLNTAGLRALTANIRALNDMLGALKGETAAARNPRLPSDGLTLPADWKMPSLANLYTPNSPPAIDELIQEPRLNIPPTQSTEFTSSTQPLQSLPSLPSLQSFPSPQDPKPLTLDPNSPSTLAPILSRFPQTITNPNHQLPTYSTRPADYASVLNLDLVPQTPCVPTLPLAAPDLAPRIQTNLDQITDTTINLRADLLPKTEPPSNSPTPSVPSLPSTPSPSPDSSVPTSSLGKPPP